MQNWQLVFFEPSCVCYTPNLKWRALIRGGVNSIPLSKKYYSREGEHQPLTGSKVPEDSSDFDDSVCVLIVMTWSLIWATLRFFRLNIIFRIPPADRKYFSESRRLAEIIFRIPPAGRIYFSRIPPADLFRLNFLTFLVPSTLVQFFRYMGTWTPPPSTTLGFSQREGW